MECTHTTKQGNIVLHPLKHLALVIQSIVWLDLVSICQKSIWSYAIVEGDHHNVASTSLDQPCAVVVGVAVVVKATALDEEIHGQL